VTVGTRLRRSDLADGLLAAALVVAILGITAHIPRDSGQRSLDVGGVAVIVVAAASLAARRRAPVAVLAVVTGALVVYAVRNYAGGPVYATFFIALHAMATSLERRRAVPVAAAAIGVACLTMLLRGGGAHTGWVFLVLVGWGAAVVLWAEAARNRRAYLAGLEDRARRLEETREEEARRRVAEERLRIARDVHDVVAHSLASISVQSGVAAHVLDKQPEQARDALVAINQAAKEALADLRRTLGQLREGKEDAPLAPTPGLGQLDTLVANAGRSGVAVTVDVAGERRAVSPAVDAAAFRILQESLTNVVRHAGPATAHVSVTYGPDFVDVEVADDGAGAAQVVQGHGNGHGNARGSGHGIDGMRERAASLGGWVDAGPRPDGGFRVRARLPEGAAS
jgi:signal transduction histidine kinase